MDPHAQFCHNLHCPARGQLGMGQIRVHSPKERRYRCTTCGQTFAATRDTPFYRLKKSVDLVTIVITLLCHGCPVQAVVAAFGLDERTVADGRDRAGRHGQRLHEQVVLQGQVDLQHVQADELYAKVVGRRLWMAMAMAVPSRLWLGGMVRASRDMSLITGVVQMVRRAAKSMAFLVCVDGLASYVTAFQRVFRNPVRTGQRGRPRRAAIPGLLWGQVIKHRAGRRLVSITRRVVLGTAQAVAAALATTGTGTGINNVVHRAAQRDLPRRAESPGASRPGVGSGRKGLDRVDVLGGLCLQLLLGARQPPERCRARRTFQVARSNSSNGGRAHGPLLDDARVVELPDPVAALGCPQAPGTPAEANSGSCGGSGMITIPWGATRSMTPTLG